VISALENPLFREILAEIEREKPQYQLNWKAAVGWAVVIVLITVVSFRNVLFNFFAGDDFAFLPLLKMAVQHPEMVYKQFYSPWMDGNHASFYRPLITLSMFEEFRLWGANGLYFRLTNLTCHLLSSLALGFIVFRIAAENSPERKDANFYWAVGSAALFALYPLHAEVVDWIVGRTDGFATMFCLFGFAAYLCWRQTNQKVAFGLCLAFTMLGLLSKEIAVTVPPLCFLYQLFWPSNRVKANFPSRVLAAFKATLFLWVVLGAYFCLRLMALGTFVGGYDNSLFFISNKEVFIPWWIHALRMTVVPLNGYIFGAHSLITKVWLAFLGASTILLGATAWYRRNDRRTLAFLLGWGILALVPVYKIFAIWIGLSGSRYAYLVSAPLCALLACGFFRLGKNVLINSFLAAVFAAFCLLNAHVLYVNNQVWADAGRTLNKIVAEFNRFYKTVPGDPETLVIGLPDHIQGAGGCFCAIEGMTQTPEIERDTHNCFMLDQLDKTFPLGYLKDTIWQHRNQYKLLWWDAAHEKLVPLPITASNQQTTTWQGAAMNHVLAADALKNATGKMTEEGIEFDGAGSPNALPSLELALGDLPCWTTDFLRLKIRLKDLNGINPKSEANLLFQNDVQHHFELESRMPTRVLSTLAPQALTFGLRGWPLWTMGGNCHRLKILFPPNSHFVIQEISVVQPNELLPKLSFANGDSLKTEGMASFTSATPAWLFRYDGSAIPKTAKMEFQITKPSVKFECFNDNPHSDVLVKTIPLKGSKGQFVLQLPEFPSRGTYEGRLAALDASGNYVGVAGDHIILSVIK
jgi:hypothetical protein